MSDSIRCAGEVIGQLLGQGVTDIVLAPGSRSAPLALVADAAAAAGQVRLHVRVDERAAGFLALGLAKGTRRCVPVVTTSGTAVGNLVPAVMEAHHSGVPLLVLSADRPAALVGFGANQTTEQADLFSGFVRYRARVSSRAPAKSWSAQAARAVLLAEGRLGAPSGPSHLNIELAEPLVPSVGQQTTAAIRAGVQVADRGDPAAFVLTDPRRTVIVVGDASVAVGRQAVALAESAAAPLLAEPSSNARVGANAIATGRLLVAGELGAQVQRVVVFGRPALSRSVLALLSRDDVEVIVVGDAPGFPDPGWRASLVAGALVLPPGDPEWLASWQSADLARRAEIAAILAEQSVLTGPEVARLVVGSVPGDQILFLGNSNPIRDADLAEVHAGPGPVLANRGLSGIDGTISTAIGVALGLATPTTLLCGDLSFVHDCGSLVIGEGEPRPQLRVVVADDAGGSIFATLEYGRPEFGHAFERVFATPSGVDLVALASGLGIPARRINDAGELAAALAEPISEIEVLVVGVDRQGRGDLTALIAG